MFGTGYTGATGITGTQDYWLYKDIRIRKEQIKE
jgi:hypothetical protein